MLKIVSGAPSTATLLAQSLARILLGTKRFRSYPYPVKKRISKRRCTWLEPVHQCSGRLEPHFYFACNNLHVARLPFINANVIRVNCVGLLRDLQSFVLSYFVSFEFSSCSIGIDWPSFFHACLEQLLIMITAEQHAVEWEVFVVYLFGVRFAAGLQACPHVGLDLQVAFTERMSWCWPIFAAKTRTDRCHLVGVQAGEPHQQQSDGPA